MQDQVKKGIGFDQEISTESDFYIDKVESGKAVVKEGMQTKNELCCT